MKLLNYFWLFLFVLFLTLACCRQMDDSSRLEENLVKEFALIEGELSQMNRLERMAKVNEIFRQYNQEAGAISNRFLSEAGWDFDLMGYNFSEKYYGENWLEEIRYYHRVLGIFSFYQDTILKSLPLQKCDNLRPLLRLCNYDDFHLGSNDACLEFNINSSFDISYFLQRVRSFEEVVLNERYLPITASDLMEKLKNDYGWNFLSQSVPDEAAYKFYQYMLRNKISCPTSAPLVLGGCVGFGDYASYILIDVNRRSGNRYFYDDELNDVLVAEVYGNRPTAAPFLKGKDEVVKEYLFVQKKYFEKNWKICADSAGNSVYLNSFLLEIENDLPDMSSSESDAKFILATAPNVGYNFVGHNLFVFVNQSDIKSSREQLKFCQDILQYGEDLRWICFNLKNALNDKGWNLTYDTEYGNREKLLNLLYQLQSIPPPKPAVAINISYEFSEGMGELCVDIDAGVGRIVEYIKT